MGLKPLAPSKRSGRVRFAPEGITGKRLRSYRDQLPSLFPTLPRDLSPDPQITAMNDAPALQQPNLRSIPTEVPGTRTGEVVWLKSPIDDYGMFRIYPTAPSYIPTARSIEEVSDGPSFAGNGPSRSSGGRSGVGGHPAPVTDSSMPNSSARSDSHQSTATDIPPTSYAPFANASIYNFMQWHGSLPAGNVMSNDASDRLIHEVIKAPGFSPADFPDSFRTGQEEKRLDAYDLNTLFPSSYGWTCDTIRLPLPCTAKKCSGGEDAVYHFPVEDFYHRKLIDVICNEVASATSRNDFHITPFQWYRKDPSEGPNCTPERVVDNMYNSDVMIEEHIRLSTTPRQHHQDKEVVVVGIQFWSDSTHVADFGTASMWPAYMAFANQCKYTKGDPRTQSIHHIAYLPKVCDGHCCDESLRFFQ